MRVILQQFLWRQRQDSGFLHPEKTRDFLGTNVLKCGERAAMLAIWGAVRATLEITFYIRRHSNFSEASLLYQLILGV